MEDKAQIVAVALISLFMSIGLFWTMKPEKKKPFHDVFIDDDLEVWK